MKVYSYVVEHDNGYAPNPYFKVCTLCRCKYRKSRRKPKNIVELADVGDWVIGTGGASDRSAGHEKLVYAMRVDEWLTREEYFSDKRFAQKKPVWAGTYEQARGDNEAPRNEFEKRNQFALISRHFYYFGASALAIPKRFKNFEKKGPGFRYVDSAKFVPFLEWLKKESKPGKRSEPRGKVVTREDLSASRADGKPKGSERCKSSC